MTDWTESGVDGRIAEVSDKTTPTGQAYLKREFTYATTDDGVDHVQTLTLSEYDGSAWTAVRQLTYDYYGTSESYGLPGDLKTIVTEQWDAVSGRLGWRRHQLLPLLHGHDQRPRAETRVAPERLRRLRGRLRRPR